MRKVQYTYGYSIFRSLTDDEIRELYRKNPKQLTRFEYYRIDVYKRQILGIARDAAFLYWMTDEEKFAKLAAGVFDTYMTCLLYTSRCV